MTASSIDRASDDGGLQFLIITPDSVELGDMEWFTDYESREASYSRSRRRTPLTIHVLAPGAVYPQLFTTSGGERLAYGYAEGRRFAQCRGWIEVVPMDPTGSPERYPYLYWEHDPDFDADEPAVLDVETVPLPTRPCLP